MAKIRSIQLTSIQLTDGERSALEKAWRQGKSHAFRQRCQMILLKAEQRPSKEVAKQVGCCESVAAKSWSTPGSPATSNTAWKG